MTELTAQEERENLRNIQKLFLEDQDVRNLYTNAIVNGNDNFGRYDKNHIQYAFAESLGSDSPHIKEIVSNATKDRLSSHAKEVLKQGGDIYKNPALLNYGEIDKESLESYNTAIDNVYVQDILDNLGDINISPDSYLIPRNTRNQTMQEFKVSHEETYNLLYGKYTNHIIDRGIMNSIANRDNTEIRSLEEKLNITQEEMQMQEELENRIRELQELRNSTE